MREPDRRTPPAAAGLKSPPPTSRRSRRARKLPPTALSFLLPVSPPPSGGGDGKKSVSECVACSCQSCPQPTQGRWRALAPHCFTRLPPATDTYRLNPDYSWPDRVGPTHPPSPDPTSAASQAHDLVAISFGAGFTSRRSAAATAPRLCRAILTMVVAGRVGFAGPVSEPQFWQFPSRHLAQAFSLRKPTTNWLRNKPPI